jgi:catechol 2,3-dioxygenase-like lactoylglutathione lyase family enzyme
VTTARVDGLSVVLLLSRDVAQVRAFSRDVLGLPLQEEQHDGRYTHYACRLGTVSFTIQPAADLGAPDPDRRYDFLQLCFTVADLDALLRHWRDRNVTALHAPAALRAHHLRHAARSGRSARPCHDPLAAARPVLSRNEERFSEQTQRFRHKCRRLANESFCVPT